MNNIQDILTPKEIIFDPEDLTRDILFQRLAEYFQEIFINTKGLLNMRELVVDLSGEDVQKDRANYVIPLHIARLNCIDYAQMSPINRRGAINSLLEHMRLPIHLAPEILGASRWEQLQAIIDAKVGDNVPEKAAQVLASEPLHSQEAIDQGTVWSQKMVAGKLMSLLDETYSLTICQINDVRQTLNELRLLRGMREVLASARDPGLYGVCGRSLRDMDLDTLNSMPDAFLDAMALNAESGPMLFGDDLWAQLVERFSQGIAVAKDVKRKTDLQANAANRKSSLFRRFGAFLKRSCDS